MFPIVNVPFSGELSAKSADHGHNPLGELTVQLYNFTFIDSYAE